MQTCRSSRERRRRAGRRAGLCFSGSSGTVWPAERRVRPAGSITLTFKVRWGERVHMPCTATVTFRTHGTRSAHTHTHTQSDAHVHAVLAVRKIALRVCCATQGAATGVQPRLRQLLRVPADECRRPQAEPQRAEPQLRSGPTAGCCTPAIAAFGSAHTGADYPALSRRAGAGGWARRDWTGRDVTVATQ